MKLFDFLFAGAIDRRVAAFQNDLITRHCDEVDNIYRKMRGWRHDYHNHIQTLLALTEDPEALRKYLWELNDDLTTVDTVLKTGGKWQHHVAYNINTPDLPKEEIKGVKYTIVGEREYDNDIQLISREGAKSIYKYGGEPLIYEGKPDNIDVIAIQNGYASISPIRYDLTAHRALADLEEWRIGK